MSEKRLPVLDSLRGVAALMVLFTHCYAIWPEEARDGLHWLNHTPLRLFINGSAAVTFFFVLSGFVLALPFLAGHAPRYPDFVLRRFCRIYLPFLATLLLAWGLRLLVGGASVPGTSAWFNMQWQEDFDWLAVLRHLAMTGTVADMNLNSAIWTIICELRVALIFPLLLWLCRVPLRGMLSGIGLFVACTFILRAHVPPLDPCLLDTDDEWATLFITGRQVPFFMLGILLAQYREPLKALAQRLPFWLALPVWLAVFVILCAPHYALETVLEGFAAAFLLIAVQIMPLVQRILVLPPLAWLGRVSFSLYLIHIPVIFALFHVTAGRWPFAATVAVGTALTFAAAQIVYVLIERPAIRLGRRFGAKTIAAAVPAPSAPAAP